MIMPLSNPMDDARKRMVQSQIAARGVRTPAVLKAMETVPRELFVPDNLLDHAFDDSPLPIGWEQTISQPYIVALMTDMLDVAGEAPLKILEIGSGSGYQAAVMAYMGHNVISIERLAKCAELARDNLGKIHLPGNVDIVVGDGCLGQPDNAPFDRVIVTAAAPKPPAALLDQLATGGVMVVPAGTHYLQKLLKITKKKDGVAEIEDGIPCRFVPLIGDGAFQE